MIIFSNILLILGCASFLIAALGLFRMPDSLAKLHAGTKASALGLMLLLLGAALRFPQPFEIFLALATLLLIFLTAPLASHALAKKLISKGP